VIWVGALLSPFSHVYLCPTCSCLYHICVLPLRCVLHACPCPTHSHLLHTYVCCLVNCVLHVSVCVSVPTHLPDTWHAGQLYDPAARLSSRCMFVCVCVACVCVCLCPTHPPDTWHAGQLYDPAARLSSHSLHRKLCEAGGSHRGQRHCVQKSYATAKHHW